MNKRVRINFRESSKLVTPDVTIEYTDETGNTVVNEEVLQETYDLFKGAQRLVLGKNIEKINLNSRLP